MDTHCDASLCLTAPLSWQGGAEYSLNHMYIMCMSDAQVFLVCRTTQCWNSRHADIDFLCSQPIARYDFLSDEAEERFDTPTESWCPLSRSFVWPWPRSWKEIWCVFSSIPDFFFFFQMLSPPKKQSHSSQSPSVRYCCPEAEGEWTSEGFILIWISEEKEKKRIDNAVCLWRDQSVCVCVCVMTRSLCVPLSYIKTGE